MIRYAGAFLFSGAIPLLHRLHPVAPLLILPAILVLLLGSELLARRGAVPAALRGQATYRALPILYIGAQLALIAWAALAASRADNSGFAALVLSVGLTTGVFGMLSAHEMVHSKDRGERFWGALMLTGMTYRHFRVAHIFGHHRWAATERDAATARLSESFYAFLVRTVPAQFIEAWRFETMRCRSKDFPQLRNRVNRDVAVSALVFALAIWAGGLRAAGFLALESAVAIAVLEMFNYVAHYGLIRERNADGGLEPFAPHHSWNSSNVLANPVIFNMGRHSDHHARPSAPYQTLRHIARAPELPAGYAGSILLALVPPLWRGIMDPKVLRLRS
ncbi:MAG: alkane 1-monooxygenase [Rhizomicrobium sp.]